MTHAEHDDDLEITIAEPCSEAWEGMSGDARRRYCETCALFVHFGPALTRKQALDLVRGSSERVCMFLEFEDDGRARFKPEPVSAEVAPARGSRWIASASAALLAACARTEPAVPSLAAPPVPEASAPLEPEPCREPTPIEATVLDPLPVVIEMRQPIPPAASAEEQPRGIAGGRATVTRRIVRTGGAVAVRRVQKPPATPK